MPRRNNRKQYKNEGRLGFNPGKYLTRMSRGYSCTESRTVNCRLVTSRTAGRSVSPAHCPDRLAICVDYSPRDKTDRRKAHSNTRRIRRAMKEVLRMQQSASRVVIPDHSSQIYPDSDHTRKCTQYHNNQSFCRR